MHETIRLLGYIDTFFETRLYRSVHSTAAEPFIVFEHYRFSDSSIPCAKLNFRGTERIGLNDNPRNVSKNSFQDEWLNINWYMSLEYASDKIKRWQTNYKEFYLLSAIFVLKPVKFLLCWLSDRYVLFSLLLSRYSP